LNRRRVSYLKSWRYFYRDYFVKEFYVKNRFGFRVICGAWLLNSVRD